MRIDKMIPVVAIVGVMVLFMFPEPESNFGRYVLTALGFVGIVVVLFLIRRNSNF
ncbi:hypothetical protein J4226_02420 [Candidatus Pacearchaeota archaeon]|nr:hypothetical protein [Candidatus Pacearchaeota archaeon]